MARATRFSVIHLQWAKDGNDTEAIISERAARLACCKSTPMPLMWLRMNASRTFKSANQAGNQLAILTPCTLARQICDAILGLRPRAETCDFALRSLLALVLRCGGRTQGVCLRSTQ